MKKKYDVQVINKLCMYLYVISQTIDAHCHGRDLEQANVMTVFQTMYEAMLSGVGTVCFMPNTSPAIDNSETLEKYLKLIKDAEEKLNYKVKGYVWVALTDTNHDEVIRMLTYDRVVGVKVYLLKDDGTSTTTGAVGIKKWISLDLLLQMMKKMIEIDSSIDKPISGHWVIPSMGHTVESEFLASCIVVNYARKYPDAKFVACHMTTQMGVEVFSDAQKDGLQIMIEFVPQHLYFSSDVIDITKGINMCFPPVRGPQDKDFILSFIKKEKNNPFVELCSDSAPHPKEDKEKDEPPRGLATLQHIVPVLLTLNDEHDLGLTEKDVENLTCNNAAKFLDIPIPKEKVTWRFAPHKDDRVYNNGKVLNPFKGKILNWKIEENK